MKKWLSNTNIKKWLSWLFLAVPFLYIALVAIFKDSLTDYASKSIQSQAAPELISSQAAWVDSAFNYSKNGLNYSVTFLEFGAKGCSACKRMEQVMSDIQSLYPTTVNVVFINILLPQNQDLMKYFGVATIPTQVLLDNQGKEYFRHAGYFSTNELLVHLIQN
jgi:thioredoxin 1